MNGERRVPISRDADIVIARQEGRLLSSQLGFSGSHLTLIATAISELARNILEYAQEGEIVLRLIEENSHRGILVVASDKGPGIANIPQAMQDGYSTSLGLGIGLPGTRRLMDEFDIISQVGKGTTVTAKKWVL